jgi:hypothetical protein
MKTADGLQDKAEHMDRKTRKRSGNPKAPGMTAHREETILALAEDGLVTVTKSLILHLTPGRRDIGSQPTTCEPFIPVHGKEFTQGHQGKEKPWTRDSLQQWPH